MKKSALLLMAGLMATVNFSEVQAQDRPIPAGTNDISNYSSSSLSVQNTGTGSLTGRQVMVYDLSDGTSKLGWQYYSHASNLQLNQESNAYDPDVVMATFNELDYALAVFINQSGYVEWESYVWNTSSNAFELHQKCTLGTTNNCGNPNVDVNANGMVVITWHEKTLVNKTWNISFTDENIVLNSEYDLPDQGYFDFIASDIFAAYGYVDGSGDESSGSDCRCTDEGPVVIAGTLNCKGDQVSPSVNRPMNGNKLYEYNISPDVSISTFEDNNTRISFTYINGNYIIDETDAGISSTSQTVYHHEIWNTISSKIFLSTGLKGKPRIASRKIVEYQDDIEIVTASGSCNNWKINNWGIFEGNEHPIVLVNPEYIKRYSIEPVVTYRGGNDGEDGIYTIAWTTETDFCLDEAYQKDVHARSFLDGSPQPGTAFLHSYVNKGNIQSNGLDGNQSIPSISGRLNDDGVNYLFYEDFDSNEMLYKYSQATAGAAQLKTAPAPGKEIRDIKSQNTGFSGYPNPFENTIKFEFTLDKNETGQFIIINDMRGKEVKRIPLKDYHEGVNSISWSTENTLPAGAYIARVITSKGIKTIEISVEK